MFQPNVVLIFPCVPLILRLSDGSSSFRVAPEDILSAHRIAVLLALCFGVNLAWGQNAPQAGFDPNAIGKVLTAAGTVRIEHSAAVIIQANLPKNDSSQAKV